MIPQWCVKLRTAPSEPCPTVSPSFCKSSTPALVATFQSPEGGVGIIQLLCTFVSGVIGCHPRLRVHVIDCTICAVCFVVADADLVDLDFISLTWY